MPLELLFWRIFVEHTSISLHYRMLKSRIRHVFVASVLTVAVVLSSSPAHAQTVVDTFDCTRISTIDLGAILSGVTIQDTLYLVDRDTSNTSDTVRFVSIPSGNFSLSDTSQAILLSNQRPFVTTILFSRPTPGTSTDSVVLATTRGGCEATYHIIAEAVAPDTNNSIVPLKHTSHNIIAFKKSDSSRETLQLHFKNNFDSSITIDSLTLQNGSAFRIDSSSVDFPATIAADSSFKVSVSFTARTAGFYTDFIGMPGRPIIPLSIQGLFQPNQGFQSFSNSISTYVWVYPNPSQGLVTIHTESLSHASVSITDVLGRPITKQQSFADDWMWNPTSQEGGTYFVAVSGTTVDGLHIHEIHRIEILR